MGFWKRAERPAPPTTLDHGAWEQRPLPDTGLEKEGQSEGEVHSPHHVSSELERRVVRKLDLGVVPLVSALCWLLILVHHGEHSSLFHRSSCLP